MNVISQNKEQTVGVITDPTKIQHIGTFTPEHLRDWMKMVLDMYGDHQEIHLFVRRADNMDAYIVYASSNGENPFVALCGRYKSDGSGWQQEFV
jgi:hypothetical protein